MTRRGDCPTRGGARPASAATRAQAFSLEAFVASILLVATLAFALQAVAIDANTASSADAELRNQHAGIAAGVLEGAADSGELQSTLVYWDESEEQFYGANENASPQFNEEEVGYYVTRNPNTSFGRATNETLQANGIRYNVDLRYRTADGDRRTQRLIEHGTPGHDAVRLTETVTLYDDTALVDRDDESPRENVTLASVEDDFYAPDAAPDSPLYNVIRVEVVVWRG